MRTKEKKFLPDFGVSLRSINYAEAMCVESHMRKISGIRPDASRESAIVHSSLLDEVWRGIREKACAIGAVEPLMSRRMNQLVLQRASLKAALAAVLAEQLRCDYLEEAELNELICEVLDLNGEIMSNVAADLVAVKERDPACPNYLHVLLNLKGFHALQAYRFAHSLWSDGRKELAFTISNRASRIFSVDIHPAAKIGCGVMLDHGTGIVIGETAIIEDRVSILQNVTLGGTGKESGDRHPKIRRGVMIGAGASVLGNIEVGAMSRIAAGSVVLKAVPPYCTVAGVPAKVVREHSEGRFPSIDMDQRI